MVPCLDRRSSWVLLSVIWTDLEKVNPDQNSQDDLICLPSYTLVLAVETASASCLGASGDFDSHPHRSN